MSERQIFIQSFEFELKVTLTNQHIHLLLFHRISQKHYSQQYSNKSLPYFALSLFHNISGLFTNFQEISLQQSEIALSRFFIFEPPKLSLISFVCGGQKRIMIDFQLNELNPTENYLLLSERLSKQQSEERILSRKWERLHANYLEQKKKEQQLMEKLRQVNSLEILHSKMNSQKKSRLQQVKKNIELKYRQLSNLVQTCQQYQFLPHNQNNNKQSSSQTIQFRVENESAIEKREYRILKVQSNLGLGTQKLVTRNYIAPHTTYNLSISIINLNFDIIIGISSSSEFNEIKKQSAECVALSCETQSLYVCGIQFFLDRPLQTKPQDRLTLLLDRVKNTIQFSNNDQRICFLQIPITMSQKRLYPFLCLSPGDQIEIESFNQIIISSK